MYFQDELEYQLQNFKLVVPDTKTYSGYVYNKERVLYVPGMILKYHFFKVTFKSV